MIKAASAEVRASLRGIVETVFYSGPTFTAGRIRTPDGGLVNFAGKVFARPNDPVRLEGHTDSVPIHTARFHSNWELSAARSIGMMELLSDKFGIQRQRMAIAGYADTAPLDSNDTQDGRAHNRRVDVVILNQQVKSTEGGSVPSGAPAPPKPAGQKPETK